MEKRIGIIRRYHTEAGWGIVHSYDGPTARIADKFFVHVANRATKDIELRPGMKISFTPGSARFDGELPPALDIAVAPDDGAMNGGAR